MTEEDLTVHVIERDLDDDMVLACAPEAKVDYIVNRNDRLLEVEEYAGVQIVLPPVFLSLLQSV